MLCLRLAPPGTLVAEQLDMRFKNAHVLANEHAHAVGRYLPDGRIFWFTANVVIPASHANGAAIEFMTPAQAARQLQAGLATFPGVRKGDGIFGQGSTAGAIHVPQGIAIASRCGELQVYGVTAGVRPIEEMRQVLYRSPQRLPAYVGAGQV